MNQPLVNLGTPPITAQQAKHLVQMVIASAGVRSGSDKPEFVRTRLAKRLQHLGCTSFDDYIRIFRTPQGTTEEQHLVEALTTHTTSFFRESAHFDWIAEHAIPARLKDGLGKSSDLIVWSAAVSTGAELWSTAITIEEFMRETDRTVRYGLTGTDVSRPVLAKAAKAVFSEPEIKGISEDLRRRYLLRTPRDFPGEKQFKIVPKLQNRAKLAYANLMDLSSGPKISADIVLLRNVLIYFDRDTQRRVAEQIMDRLRPGGFLFIAHTESLRGMVDGLESVGNAIYQKVAS